MEAAVYKKFVSVMYVLNIVFQAIFTLATPIALGILASWLLTEYAGTPPWIYAPLVILGVLSGFYSMVKFVLSAGRALERLEAEQNENDKNKDSGNNNEEKKPSDS